MSERPQPSEDTEIWCIPTGNRNINTKSLAKGTNDNYTKVEISVVGPFTSEVIESLADRDLTPVKMIIGTTVTSITNGAIGSCPELTTIYISPTVETIESNAIANCPKLNLVEIPDEVAHLNPYCIHSCPCVIDSEKGYYYVDNCVTASNNPSGVLDLTGMRIIGSSIFSNQSITSVVLDESLIKIDDGAFSSCSTLSTVDFSNCTSLATIGSNAFLECESLSGTLDFSNTILTNIKNGAFSYCGRITGVVLNSTLETIGDEAFYYCSEIQTIDMDACESLKSIGIEAFYYCYQCSNINLPDSIENISSGAFQDSGLVNVTLPQNLKIMGTRVFQNCEELISLDFSNTNNDLIAIGENVCNNCPKLSSVVLPSNLQQIEESAFYGCSSLTYITIPDVVEYIGTSAFYNSGLTILDIPNSVEMIDESAFELCSKLTTVNISISSSLRVIGLGAFNMDTKLTSINLPNGLEEIGRAAFYKCGLTTLNIPSTVKNNGIGVNAFQNTSLTSLTFLGKTLEQVQAMSNYSWGIEDTSIINVQS